MLSDLRAFIEERGGQLSQYEQVRDALNQLRQRQQELASAPLPPGCRDIRNSHFNHKYPPSARVDLPADGRFHQIDLLESDNTCQILFRVVPRQSCEVFRFARLRNPAAAPLAGGPLQVFLDGAFVVTSTLSPCGASTTLRLNLGVEEGIRVARNATFHQSEKGMISTESVLDHTVCNSLVSRMPEPVLVEVFERLPIADGVEGIDFELVEAGSPAPQRDRGPLGDEQIGALRWELSLQPNEKTEVTYRYSIAINANKELEGGNRREP